MIFMIGTKLKFMNIQRKQNENRPLKDLLEEINNRLGLTTGNSQVAREMVRIYNKMMKHDVILQVKKEAALRVLYGQEDRCNIFENITNCNKNDQKYNFN